MYIWGTIFFSCFYLFSLCQSCKFKKKQLQCTPDPIFLLTCHNFLLSLHLLYLTNMWIFAGESEKRNLGFLWSLCPSLESQRIDFFPLLQVLIFILDNLGSASQTWFILRIFWDLPLELYVPEVRVGLTAALGMNLEPIHFIWPLSTAQSSLNCKVLEMGGKNNPFLTFPYPPDHVQLFSPATMG